MPHPARVAHQDIVDAAGPDRVISTARLRELGVSAATISRRCRPGGPWTPILRGVVLLVTGVPSPRQRLAAAQEFGGPDSVITGFAATRVHGLRRGPDDELVRVLVPHTRHVSSHRFVVVERTTRPPRFQTRDGIRLATVTRALISGARGVPVRDDVRAVLAEAVQRGRTTPQLLGEELDSGAVGGSALVRSVLAEVRDGVRSVAECWARDAVRASPLPAPLWNPALHGPSRFLARPDAYWADLGVAWQIDSREWHLDPESWERTLRRRALLEAGGIVVVSTLPRWLREDRAGVVAELAAARARAAMLPQPAVRVVPLP